VIVAAGLTPAWQQILRFERLRTGEVNRAVEAVWCGSGKVLNVGIALSQLGAQTLTISPLGGPAYEAIEREFAALGVPRCWIRSRAPTRVCTTLLDESTQATTELVENAGALDPAELAEFERVVVEQTGRDDLLVLTGSLPQGTPVDLYRRLLERTSARAILDVRGPELLAALAARPLVVKPNREELGHTLGQPLNDDRALVAAMQTLIERGATWVVVSAGKDPLWICSRSGIERMVPLVVDQVVNPIGCGDCLAAGIAWGLAAGKSIAEAVSLGMAAASENLAQLLPARLNPTTVTRRAEQLGALHLPQQQVTGQADDGSDRIDVDQIDPRRW
jgi:tagatose 6-phosphate kinase